jgi:hypothetical protein
MNETTIIPTAQELELAAEMEPVLRRALQPVIDQFSETKELINQLIAERDRLLALLSEASETINRARRASEIYFWGSKARIVSEACEEQDELTARCHDVTKRIDNELARSRA